MTVFGRSGVYDYSNTSACALNVNPSYILVSFLFILQRNPILLKTITNNMFSTEVN